MSLAMTPMAWGECELPEDPTLASESRVNSHTLLCAGYMSLVAGNQWLEVREHLEEP